METLPRSSGSYVAPTNALPPPPPPNRTDFEELLEKPVGVFEDPERFAHAQRVAKMLISSKLAPEMFRGDENFGSAVIAVDMAFRLKMNPLMVMQQIYVVYGKPGWSSQFVIACLNSCGRFEPLQWEVQPLAKKTVDYSYTVYVGRDKERKTGKLEIVDRQFTAWTTNKGVRLPTREDGKPWTIERAKEAGYVVHESPPVTFELAIKEGWFTKDGSKWQTMPDLMGRYRAATFFGRLYAPEILMGMQAVEELRDSAGLDPEEQTPQTTAPRFGKAKEKRADPKPESSESKAVTSAETSSASTPSSSLASSSSAPGAPKEKARFTPQEQLSKLCIEHCFGFKDFRRWGLETGEVDAAAESFTDLSDEEAMAFIGNWDSISKDLERLRQ